MLKFIHAADFHLDSAFAALPPEKAAEGAAGTAGGGRPDLGGGAGAARR
mgnify:CR=1 FL=1